MLLHPGHLLSEAGNLVGVFAFAISGALLAVRKNMDVLGILVLAVATALGGGVARDVLIGAVPPAAFTDPGSFWTPVAAAAVVYFLHPQVQRINAAVQFFDAAGLGLFCVTGTVKAHQHGLALAPACALGVVTAVGGGLVRDVLARERPALLRWDREVYAVPAMVGAALTGLLVATGGYSVWTGVPAALVAFGLRLLALKYHWRAPRARRRPRAGKRPGTCTGKRTGSTAPAGTAGSAVPADAAGKPPSTMDGCRTSTTPPPARCSPRPPRR